MLLGKIMYLYVPNEKSEISDVKHSSTGILINMKEVP